MTKNANVQFAENAMEEPSLLASGGNISAFIVQHKGPNPIAKAIDIDYSKKIIREYYAGMKTLHDKKRMIGFTRILSSNKFHKVKNHKKSRA